jgi:hypothetical protein
MTTDGLPALENECFFVAPIGAEGTDVRDRSDGVLDYIVTPAAQALGLTAIRADKIAKPGEITRQVIEHVVGARASVVDLTEANPNVYYEMAVRHTARLPTVLIAQEGEILPFDIAQMRTIFFDHRSLKSAADCRQQIEQHLTEAMSGEVDSPISSSVRVQHLEQGSPQDRVLAQIVDGLDEVRVRLAGLVTPERPGMPHGEFEIPIHVAAIEDLAAALVRALDPASDYALSHDHTSPLKYMVDRAIESNPERDGLQQAIRTLRTLEVTPDVISPKPLTTRKQKAGRTK